MILGTKPIVEDNPKGAAMSIRIIAEADELLLSSVGELGITDAEVDRRPVFPNRIQLILMDQQL
jgi:hypothetical protein